MNAEVGWKSFGFAQAVAEMERGNDFPDAARELVRKITVVARALDIALVEAFVELNTVVAVGVGRAVVGRELDTDIVVEEVKGADK